MSEISDPSEEISPVEVTHSHPEPPSTLDTATSWRSTWQRYEGMAYVLAGEIFGAGMIGAARMLQNGTESKPGMATVQVCPAVRKWFDVKTDHSLDHLRPLQHDPRAQHTVHVVDPSP
jgi:hypothetical protein